MWSAAAGGYLAGCEGEGGGRRRTDEVGEDKEEAGEDHGPGADGEVEPDHEQHDRVLHPCHLRGVWRFPDRALGA